MSSGLQIGLYISVVGLAVTFLVLGLLILLILLLVRLFPAVEAPTNDPDEARREETAAALAVGVSLLLQGEGKPDQDSALGRLLES